MPERHAIRRIGRRFRNHEQRLTDLEQGRPPESPRRDVATVTGDGVETADTVTITVRTTAGGYGETEYDESTYD